MNEANWFLTTSAYRQDLWMDMCENHSGQLWSPILSSWAIYRKCIASGKDHIYFYKPVMIWPKNSFPLSGKVIFCSWRRPGKKGIPLSQLNQHASTPETNPQVTGLQVQHPHFPGMTLRCCSFRRHLDYEQQVKIKCITYYAAKFHCQIDCTEIMECTLIYHLSYILNSWTQYKVKLNFRRCGKMESVKKYF